MRISGVDGPDAVGFGSRCYRDLTETTSNCYWVFDHVTQLLDGPVIRAPVPDGGIVLSMRSGDFELHVGQDMSIGYLDRTAEMVKPYLSESLTFLAHSSDAAVRRNYVTANRSKRPPQDVSTLNALASSVPQAPPAHLFNAVAGSNYRECNAMLTFQLPTSGVDVIGACALGPLMTHSDKGRGRSVPSSASHGPG